MSIWGRDNLLRLTERRASFSKSPQTLPFFETGSMSDKRYAVLHILDRLPYGSLRQSPISGLSALSYVNWRTELCEVKAGPK